MRGWGVSLQEEMPSSVWTTMSVSQSPIKGAVLCANLELWTQVMAGGMNLRGWAGVEIFETMALDQQGTQTKSQERLGLRQRLRLSRGGRKSSEAVGPFSVPKKYIIFGILTMSTAFAFLLHERSLLLCFSFVKRLCLHQPPFAWTPSRAATLC